MPLPKTPKLIKRVNRKRTQTIGLLSYSTPLQLFSRLRLNKATHPLFPLSLLRPPQTPRRKAYRLDACPVFVLFWALMQGYYCISCSAVLKILSELRAYWYTSYIIRPFFFFLYSTPSSSSSPVIAVCCVLAYPGAHSIAAVDPFRSAVSP